MSLIVNSVLVTQTESRTHNSSHPIFKFIKEEFSRQDYGDPVPCNWGTYSIESMADKVREAGRYEVGDELFTLVENFGGDVQVVDWDDAIDGESGAIIVHGKCDFTIILPPFTSPLRDRFTIAHELGHYFLHSHQGNKITASRLNTGPAELEANYFAAALLMPKKEFEKVAKETANNVSRLSSHFYVSQQAVAVRMRSLDIR